jgi:5-oxoprolinase (ATP-hydrolysing)
MTSAGQLKSAETFRPVDSLLSGPAGGIAGAAALARACGLEQVLTFDMGGTSTDVARIAGEPGYRYEQEIGPVRVLAPAVKIETVAAGGGSVCQWRNGGLQVGPGKCWKFSRASLLRMWGTAYGDGCEFTFGFHG